MPSQQAIPALRQAARQLVRELKLLGECVPGLGLSECHLLTELEARGATTASELAERLVLEKSTVSRLVQGLRRQGLLSASVDPADGRRRLLALTEAGRERVAEIDAKAEDQVGSALEFLSGDQVPHLAESMDRYARALRQARAAREIRLRPIEQRDDAAVAAIIVDVMTEFGAVGEGFSIEDPEVRAMSQAFHPADRAFFVLEDRSGEILGCAGVAPLKGADARTCELQKMYLRPSLRGTGSGRRLLAHCLSVARELGYRHCYLETLESMGAARHLYRKAGFQELAGPLGNTGHHGCNRWMVLDLAAEGRP